MREIRVDQGHLRRRVLTLMTGEFLASGHEITWLERDSHGEERLCHAVYGWIRARRRAETLGRQRRVEQIDIRVACITLNDLSCDVADETVVGVSGAALGTKGDDRRRLDRVDDGSQPRPQLPEHVEGREPAIRKAEDAELVHTEPVRCAGRLFGASGGELRSSRNVSEIRNAFGAISGDYEVSLSPFTGQT